MEEIVTIINTVGFPIAMCIYTLYILKTTMDKVLEQLKDLSNKQQDLLKEMSALSMKQQSMIDSVRILIDTLKDNLTR